MSQKIRKFFKAVPMEKAMNAGLDSSKNTEIHQNKARNSQGKFQSSLKNKYKKTENKNYDKDEKLKDETGTSGHKCKNCDKKFTDKRNLLRHIKSIHPNELEDLLDCHICHLKFIKKNALEQHIKFKHFDGKVQLFECDYCGKSTKTKSEMYYHVNMHLPTVTCHICQAELKQWSLKMHIKQTHATDQKFQCTMCPKIFKTLNLLRNHEKFHNKKFQCTECMKTFATKSQLSKHQKQIHENPRSYSCETCNKKFNRIENLKKHQKLHDRNRPKPFKCKRCSFATDNKTYNEKHIKFHQRQDEKFAAMKNPFKCSKCPTLCKDKKALRNHLKFVHLKESFQCDLCGKYLKTFFWLKCHINLHQQKRNL